MIHCVVLYCDCSLYSMALSGNISVSLKSTLLVKHHRTGLFCGELRVSSIWVEHAFTILLTGTAETGLFDKCTVSTVEEF